MRGQEKPARPQILAGWKEIANYLRKGVRTVQRYERVLALPIHRPAGKSLAAVVAIPTELDNWVTTSPRQDSRPHRLALDTRTNRLRADFLQIDSEIALTFSSIALGTSEQEKRRRMTGTARKAYDTVLRLREDTNLVGSDNDRLEANLKRLKSNLQRLGQRL